MSKGRWDQRRIRLPGYSFCDSEGEGSEGLVVAVRDVPVENEPVEGLRSEEREFATARLTMNVKAFRQASASCLIPAPTGSSDY